MNSLDIKQFRRKFSLSQEDLAKIVGTGVRGVQGWEQGTRKVPQSAIILIEKYETEHQLLQSADPSETGPFLSSPSNLQAFYDYLKQFDIVKSKSDLAEKLSYSRQYMTEMLNGTRPITSDLLTRFLQTFRSEYEQFRAGENPKPGSRTVINDVRPIKMVSDAETFTNGFGNTFIPLEDGRYLMGTPLVPHYVKGGPMAGFADSEYFSELPKHYVVVDRIYRGKYLSFDMLGDSMDYDGRDYIAGGARITGREIKKELWVGSKLHLNKYKDFVIEHKDGMCVKRITEHDTENYTITCHSLNPDKEKHPDFVLNLDDVINLFNVIKVENPR